MDLKERVFQEHDEVHRSYQDTRSRHMWSSQVVLVAAASDGSSASLQPAIKGQITDPEGNVNHVSLPLINDVPVHFPGGGGVTFTHPIAAGDEGLAIHPSRPIDSWYQSGGQQQAIDNRYHHMSDAVLIPGVRSQARKLPNVSTTTAQIRTDDGTVYIDIDPVGKTITIVVPAGHWLNLGGNPAKGDTMSPVQTASGTPSTRVRAIIS